MSDDVNPAGADTGVGAKIAGYLLEEQIGRGGMAVVFRAHDERLDRRVALKLLAPGLAADTAFRQRFIRESRAAAAVDHPNIIPVYDAGDAGGSLFIAMRYVQGGDARTALRQAGTLPPARAWAIITQVAAALDAAHSRGLVHRDVKPANMLLDATAATAADRDLLPRGQAEHVYLSDFGISKQTLASNLTSTGQFVGTLDYVAPEQIEGHQTDGRADQYSLACAAYELLSGVPPFRRDQGLALLYAQLSEPPPPISAARSGLPPAVDQVLARALAKTPDGRYSSCSQFAIELGRALNLVPGQPGAAGPADLPGTAGNVKPWPATELANPASTPDAHGTGPDAGSGHAAATPPGTPVLGLPPAVIGTEGPTRRPPGPSDEPTMLSGTGDQLAQRGGPVAPAGTPGWQAGTPAGPSAPGWQAGTPAGPSAPGWQAGTPGSPAAPGWQAGTPAGPSAPGWQTGSPGGPGWPTSPGQPPTGGRRRSGVLIGAVVAVAVVAAAVAFIKLYPHATSSSSPPPSPTTSASASSSPTPSLATVQAAAVNNLLTSSAASRMPLQSAVSEVMNCTNLPGAVAQIQTVVDQRTAEYSKAAGLSTGALHNGAALKNDLMLALLNSLDADKDYLAWAKHELNAGCPSSSSAYSAALAADGQATNSKQVFVNEWNPIASTYGYPPMSAGSI